MQKYHILVYARQKLEYFNNKVENTTISPGKQLSAYFVICTL